MQNNVIIVAEICLGW